MQWPNITNEPINEFHAPDGLATQAFPTLLPLGSGDPTCSNRCCPVSLTEAFKHLIKYGNIVNGQFKWRFVYKDQLTLCQRNFEHNK